MNIAELLETYPDLADRVDHCEQDAAEQLALLGFDPPTVGRLIDMAYGQFNEGIKVLGTGEQYVANANLAMAGSHYLAWFVLTGNPDVQAACAEAIRIPPVRTSHPIAQLTQPQIIAACIQGYGVTAERLGAMLADRKHCVGVLSAANVLSGYAIDARWHCPSCATNPAKGTDRQRLASAGLLITWTLLHKTLSDVGRELALRQQAEGGAHA